MLLGSVLDAGYEFAEFPVYLIYFILPFPELAFQMQTGKVAHVDEWRSKIKGMIRHTFQHQLIGLRVILGAVSHAVARPVIELSDEWPQRQLTSPAVQLIRPGLHAV